MFLLRPGVWDDVNASGRGPCVGSPVGWRILVPGAAQWAWRQPERAWVLFGSFATALGVAAWSWGTWTSAIVLAFAFGTQVVSAVDVVRQSAFPGFGRWMPVASISGGLAVGLYGPALSAAALLAWPVASAGVASDGYLVNRSAYYTHTPARGDWIWHRPQPWSEYRIGRVVAESGDEIEWTRQGLRVNGERLEVGLPFRSSEPPDEMAYTVPDGHVLVAPGANLSRRSSRRLTLVSAEQIKGRAWARLYPVWERRLLP